MVMAPGFIPDGPQDWLNSHQGSISPLRDAVVDFLMMLFFKEPSRISLPEQEWLELLPDLLVSPMLTKNVSWVYLTRDM